MASKSQQLQIRITPHQKTLLKERAANAGQDLSSYVLSRVLPAAEQRFAELLTLLQDQGEHRFVLAELNDLLSGLAASELREAVGQGDVSALSPFLQNYVAAMVEQACYLQGVPLPVWTARIPPLEAPWFATDLKNLRLHLLHASPVPFKRRNIFIDSSIGARV